ncbi:germ cell nuclear acidic protein-like isoform X2 [Galleria mellonella]|uniref:Germ cell nuclear acidic protein-like isoform X2 n=1 Tax=Galleria mellonella TaxID=7137 RepID=A0ABM3MUE6_GALME|nr:germ cell nuclear acidic protein-like isoform X2 [Galleria mellonella]
MGDNGMAAMEFEESVGEMEEGQEEWLSEGNLTDEEYHPAANEDQCSNPGNSSQDDAMTSANDESMDNESQGNIKDSMKIESIEKTLNSLENEVKDEQHADLEQFLIKKADGAAVESRSTDKIEDGNDTDDLLRLLGEDDDKAKIKVLVKTKPKNKVQDDDSTDDDDFVFEGSKVTQLKVTKNVLKKKYPAAKAVPEDTTDDSDATDVSRDDAEALKKIFAFKPKSQSQAAGKPTKVINASKTVTKKYVSTNSIVKNDSSNKHTNNEVLKSSDKSKVILKKVEPHTKSKQRPLSPEPDEIINEEEFLEEDDFDLDEDFDEDVDVSLKAKQLLRRPEQMDEEVPSDAESHSDDQSLYDELPSSDSEDVDDWFELDVRAERAGDYIPLLGSRAYELLTEEKRRVTERLTDLRKRLASVSESGRQQIEQLKKATKTLSELDDMLKAA